MKHHRHIWFGFAICLAVVLAAMGWISLAALRLDRAEAEARRQEEEALRKESEARAETVLEQNARLALWRIDSALAPLLGQESARPYFAYSSFLTINRSFVQMFNNRDGREALTPSPLLLDKPDNVLLYFQFEPDGKLTSPQTPVGNNWKLAVPRYTSEAAVKQAEELSVRLVKLTTREKLLAMLPEHEPAPIALYANSVQVPPLPSQVQNEQQRQPNRQNILGANGVANSNPKMGANTTNAVKGNLNMNGSVAAQQQEQFDRQNDYQQRNQFVSSFNAANVGQQQANWDNNNFMLNAPLNGDNNSVTVNPNMMANIGQNNGSIGLLTQTDISGVPMTPLWIEDQLALARRISVGGKEYVQGCLLDWPAIKTSLLEDIQDLLPNADLEPVVAPADEPDGRMLAALPVRLATAAAVKGDSSANLLSAAAASYLSPMLISLGVAWVCVLLAAAAVAVLISGVMRLSDRRATFVSAVTHELRTPLTTFQMYAEMLSEGMVPDEEQRQKYLNTLRAESLRLTHLVENVLSYARLERGRASGRMERMTLDELISPICPRLAGRAAEAGMELVVEAENGAGGALVRANSSVVEQVLFNLVDNACKYAAIAADKRIHLITRSDDGRAQLTVRDHGPGLSASARRRLFHSFAKSADEAAMSAPGVGLGLALSRRLARDMGGDLILDGQSTDGACFVLSLSQSQ
jgi:signal transduction histidine kinase